MRTLQLSKTKGGESLEVIQVRLDSILKSSGKAPFFQQSNEQIAFYFNVSAINRELKKILGGGL